MVNLCALQKNATKEISLTSHTGYISCVTILIAVLFRGSTNTMTTDQLVAFAIILASLILFAWGRWRYDIVAMAALIVAVIAGIVPANKAFAGFSDAAVVTVAAVLIISQSLQRSGAINALSGTIGKLPANSVIQIGALTLTVAVLSAFMNNVEALALMLPVAIRAA